MFIVNYKFLVFNKVYVDFFKYMMEKVLNIVKNYNVLNYRFFMYV